MIGHARLLLQLGKLFLRLGKLRGAPSSSWARSARSLSLGGHWTATVAGVAMGTAAGAAAGLQAGSAWAVAIQRIKRRRRSWQILWRVPFRGTTECVRMTLSGCKRLASPPSFWATFRGTGQVQAPRSGRRGDSPSPLWSGWRSWRDRPGRDAHSSIRSEVGPPDDLRQPALIPVDAGEIRCLVPGIRSLARGDNADQNVRVLFPDTGSPAVSRACMGGKPPVGAGWSCRAEDNVPRLVIEDLRHLVLAGPARVKTAPASGFGDLPAGRLSEDVASRKR